MANSKKRKLNQAQRDKVLAARKALLDVFLAAWARQAEGRAAGPLPSHSRETTKC